MRTRIRALRTFSGRGTYQPASPPQDPQPDRIMTRSSTLLRGAALGVAVTAAAAVSLGAQVKQLGVDTAGFDRSVRPQDDFYQFVNGNWARTNQIPADRSSFGAFVTLTDRSEAAVHQILDEAVAARSPAPRSHTPEAGAPLARLTVSAP